LIFGSIESTFFTQEQLKMVVDFVSNRGGGFLMMGGRNSFAGGRYENSPIADILPVQLSASDRAPIIGKLKLAVTDYGRTHPLMINPDKDTYLPGETVRLTAEISNKKFERMNNAKVVAKVTNPDGVTESIPLDWNGSGEGAYQAEFNATAPGMYQLEVGATQG